MTEPIRKEVSEEIKLWAEADSRMRYKMEVEMEKAAERAEGIAETTRTHALKMKEKGIEMSIILEVTGLTLAEIEAL